MIEPKPEDFGLTAMQVSETKVLEERIKSKLEKIRGITTIILTLICAFIYYYYNLGFEQIFGFTIISLILITPITYLIFRNYLNKRLKGKFKKYYDYLNAKSEFEEWFTRTSENFWKSLSGHSFEKEIGKLFEYY